MSYSVRINSKDYAVIPRNIDGRVVPVQELPVEPNAPQLITEGIHRPERVQPGLTILFNELRAGFTHDHVPPAQSEEPTAYQGFYDSRIDTRWTSGWYLPILAEDTTEATAGEVLRASAHFSGSGVTHLYSVWDKDDGAGNLGVISAQYDGSGGTWVQNVQTVYASGGETVALDLETHKTQLVCLFWNGNDYMTRSTPDGTTWNAPSTEITANLSTTISANLDYSVGRLATVGNEIVAAIHDYAADAITFFSSSDEAANWADESINIPDVGVHGVAVYPGIDDADKLYVLGSDALWEVDTSPSTWTFQKVLTTFAAGTTNFVNRLAVHKGKLWIAPHVGNSEPQSIYTMDTSGGVRTIETNLGLDQNDGVPADLLGAAKTLVSSGQMLYMSLGGHASSRNARILCHNGTGWHHMYRHGTANVAVEWIDISSRDDYVERLHFAVRASGSSVAARFLAYPNTNPLSGVSIKREAAGLIDLPYVDGGMPTHPSHWLDVRMSAADLSSSTSGEYVAGTYGEDDAARSTSTVGNFVSGTKRFQLASGAGATGNNIGLRFTLNRDGGDNTQTPRVQSIELVYLKNPAMPERFAFDIDIAATAKLRHTTPEVVISDLKTARDLATLPAFLWGPLTTASYVKIKSLQWYPTLRAGSAQGHTASDRLAQRAGFVSVVCEELVA